MINEIDFKGVKHPAFEAEGFSAQYIFPVANKVCQGVGYDIGCNRVEWAFPGSIPIDLNFNTEFNAYRLPSVDVDYIFSSHCLEHLKDWVQALEYWVDCLKPGGTLFLYLPHYKQEYWRPWHNKKHNHVLQADHIKEVLMNTKKMWKIHTSDCDINHSFVVMGERC